MDIYIRLAVGITIWRYFYVQRFINVTQQPKKYTSNNQTAIKPHFIRMYIYVAGSWRSTWKMYIYVLGCWHENILIGRETVRGSIYTSLVCWSANREGAVERIKDEYIHPWLLAKIRSARKGLRTLAILIKGLLFRRTRSWWEKTAYLHRWHIFVLYSVRRIQEKVMQ